MKKYHLVVFGCQMNQSDSERITTILEKIGYQKTKEIKKADLVVIVSCSVRQMAIDRVYGLISNLKSKISKIQIKNQKIILTGCLTKTDKKKLEKQVDLVFDIDQLVDLPRMLLRINTNSSNNLTIKQFSNYLDIPPKLSTFPIAYIPIMTGCDNFCTYCVVPQTRGREFSRPAKEILNEVIESVKNGYKMIVLLGQNVNSYKFKSLNSKFKKKSKKEIIKFPQLLKMVDDLPKEFWLTFVSSHPKDLSDKLIKTMAGSKKIMPYLHLPVQSGDNQVLKKMNRYYTVTHYKRLIGKIRDKIRTINISTDIIVGFPDETKKQFNNTAALMRQAKFDMAYIAKYSPRPGTAAEKLKDSVTTQEKKERWQVLAAILKKTALENNKKYLNKIIEALIIQTKKTKTKSIEFIGQSKNFKNIKIIQNKEQVKIKNPKPGDIIKVKIVEAISWGLKGILLEN